MRFGLSDEQHMLADTTRRILDEQVPLAVVREVASSDIGYPRDLWQVMADAGLAGVLVPHNLGGVGLSMLEGAVVAEQLGCAVAPVPYLSTALMAPTVIRLGGDDDQQARWLPAIASGELTYGIACSDSISPRGDTNLQWRDGRLQGVANNVFDVVGADAYLVVDGDARWFHVMADTPGLKRVDWTTVDKTRAVGQLVFDGVDAEPLSGESGPHVADRTIEVGRLGLAADILGAAQHMQDCAVEYAKERRQFNRVIGSFQAVKHMCAEMAAQLEPCRAMVWQAAHLCATDPDAAHAFVLHTKAHLSEVGRAVAKTATEVHGGMGFTDLLGLHYWFKRIGVSRQWLGSPEALREQAAHAQGWI
ncbi:MAG: acyl-CoA dehydrogenase family protein [Pseudomonadota bacterium]